MDKKKINKFDYILIGYAPYGQKAPGTFDFDIIHFRESLIMRANKRPATN